MSKEMDPGTKYLCDRIDYWVKRFELLMKLHMLKFHKKSEEGGK